MQTGEAGGPESRVQRQRSTDRAAHAWRTRLPAPSQGTEDHCHLQEVTARPQRSGPRGRARFLFAQDPRERQPAGEAAAPPELTPASPGGLGPLCRRPGARLRLSTRGHGCPSLGVASVPVAPQTSRPGFSPARASVHFTQSGEHGDEPHRPDLCPARFPPASPALITGDAQQGAGGTRETVAHATPVRARDALQTLSPTVLTYSPGSLQSPCPAAPGHRV